MGQTPPAHHLTCMNGHAHVHLGPAVKGCPLCGAPLFGTCPNGHAFRWGDVRCRVCGTALHKTYADNPEFVQYARAATWKSRWWIAFLALVVAAVVFAVLTFPYQSLLHGMTSPRPAPTSSTFSLYPTADHPVAGPRISLPSALFANTPSGDGVLVTADEASRIARADWPLWQKAMITNDTRALSELVAPGAFQTGIIAACALDGHSCTTYASPLVLHSLTAVVPVETSYPLYFLAEVTAAGSIPSSSSGIPLTGMTVEEIFTRGSPQNPWRIAEYMEISPQSDGSFYQFPFAFETASEAGYPSLPVTDTFNPVPNAGTPGIWASIYESSLAEYWQHWKVAGSPPVPSLFPVSGNAWSDGQELGASCREGCVTHGTANYYNFHSALSLGNWVFSAAGSLPMVCGSIVDSSQNLPAQGGGLLHQDPGRENWGEVLTPGTYSEISIETLHPVCIFSYGPGIDEISGTAYAYAATGKT